MKVLYDHQIFSDQVYGGVSRYFYEMMNYFLKDKEVNFELPILFSNNYYIENASFSKHKTFLKKIDFKGKDKLLNVFNCKKNIWSLKKQDFDIFHPTYYNPYFLDYIGGKPFVLTIFDMIHEIYPEMFYPTDKTSGRKRLLAEKAAKIIAISENTKNDIIKYFKIDHKKIEVVYLGNSLKIQECSKIEMQLPDVYLLYVGDRRSYKNFETFIKSVAKLLIKDSSLNIVCAGGKKFGIKETRIFEELGISNKIYYYSISNDDLLVYLYKNAIAFVYPSLYEGFGIPILEAFSCGCPVALSDVSSFPEIAGDAGIYFNPKDSVSIREAVKNILDNDNLKNELKNKGYEQLKKFSWEKTAEKTKDIYKNI